MVDRFYLIFEILAVFLCLHGLYREKFKWNICVILCIGMELVAYQLADMYGQKGYYKVFMFLLLFIYAKVQFKYPWKSSIINYLLCIIVTAIMQMVCYFPIMIWYYELSDYAGYFINVLLFFVMLIFQKINIFGKIALYIQQEGKMVVVFLVTAILFSIYAFYMLQVIGCLVPFEYFLTVLTVVLLLVFLLQLQKTRLINRQIKLEADLNNLYGTALGELIDKIRVNQHNYKNQLAAIQGMVYTANSLEELKTEHQEFYHNLIANDKYSDMLSGNNDPLIAGFLYSKFSDIDCGHIKVDYSLEIDKIDDSFMASDVIKILGVLIDNALEEIEKDSYQHKYMEINVKKKDKLRMEVGNVCRYISNEEVITFFQKGSSSKGNDRGLGLFSVKEMVKKWNGEISTENRNQKGQNRFYIIVELDVDKRL